MKSDQSIREELAALRAELKSAEQAIAMLRLRISHVQDLCPHNDKKRWSNDDGDGPFTVERCNVCGRQRDGGL